MDLDARIRRGERAKSLLADPLMKEAAEHIEAECWRVFKSLANDDVQGMAEVKRMQYANAKYLAFLKDAMTDGEQAKLDVEFKKKTRGLSDIVTAFRRR